MFGMFICGEDEPNLTIIFFKCQWIFQVPLKGGRDYITPQKARTISGIYCQLGDYMPPTTL